MKQNRTLLAAMVLTLSACPLLAQENQPTPPDRPPQPPRGEGGPRREGPQAEGVRRPNPGIFAALDANHDGAIDNEELAHAADVLRKLDRNGDGRITPDETTPPGNAARPQARDEDRGRREGGPQADAGERRGPRPEGARDQGPRAEGPRDQGPRGEGRGDGQHPEGARRDGDRPQGPGGEVRRDGERPRGPAPDGARAGGPRDGQHRGDFRPDGDRGRGPGAEGPRDGSRRDGPTPPTRGDGDVRREGPQGTPPGDRPQAQGHGRHHGPPPGRAGDRFAQRDVRPDFGRGGQRPAWEGGFRRWDGGQHGPMAMGPRMDERRREFSRRDAFTHHEFRDLLGARGPQGGEMRPPMPPGGGDRQGPGPMHHPNFDGPRDRPHGPRDAHQPEARHDDRREFAPPPQRGDWEPRSRGPWQDRVQ